ncbi:hypothetical protein ACFQ4C_26075 [Larkinella insperata]|uniref:Uncharacterized protein n=1 Tax=Larkinella insperata TaxID=332158 RepID=A0ABW3QA94_9BACT|nr:hypothetical protein [Larkinella insperata]
MLYALSAFFYRTASWKSLLLAIVLYLPIPIFLLRPLEARLNQLAGYEIGPIDLLIFEFDPARIQKMVADYGLQGRAIYAQGALIDDTIYPIIYTFLFCVILSLLYRRRVVAPGSLVNIFPVTSLVFDLLENAFIITLLRGYPAPQPTVAVLCLVASNLKWLSLFITAVLAIYGLVRLIKQRAVTGKLSA